MALLIAVLTSLRQHNQTTTHLLFQLRLDRRKSLLLLLRSPLYPCLIWAEGYPLPR